MRETSSEEGHLVEGFYEWGPGIVLTAECLGQSYRAGLAERTLVITCPLFEQGKGLLAEPPSRYRRPSSYVNMTPENGWGELRAWANDESGAILPQTACVKRVRIVVRVNNQPAVDLQALAPQIDDELATWWVSLRSWIEVLTSQDLSELGNRRPTGPQTFHLWTGNQDGTMRPLPMLFRGSLFPQADALTSHGLTACLAAAARATLPPPEWLLLRDARSLHNAGDWRRAVIDAATSAEIAITGWLDGRLNGAEPAVKSALLSPTRTLVRRA